MSDWTRSLLWNAIGYAIVAGFALVTLLALYLFAPTRRWLPLQRFRPGRWTGHEVLLVFCVFFGFQALLPAVLHEAGFYVHLIGPAPKPGDPELERKLYSLRCLSISSPLSLTLILGAVFTLMFVRSGSRPHHYGLTWSRWPANLGLGLVAFVLARPIVIGIFDVAGLVFTPPPDPYSLLSKHTLPAWEWSVFAFQMLVVAPLLEETVCRGILQGWLQRASLNGQLTFLSMTILLTILFTDPIRYDDKTETVLFNLGPLVFVGLLAGGYAGWLFCLHRQNELKPAEPQGATLAIVGSALFWASIHSWPAALALFPMGLVLGWLYQRTLGLFAPIAFHALFNLATFIAVYGLAISGPGKNGNEQTTALRPSVAGSTSNSVPGSQLPLRK